MVTPTRGTSRDRIQRGLAYEVISLIGVVLTSTNSAMYGLKFNPKGLTDCDVDVAVSQSVQLSCTCRVNG